MIIHIFRERFLVKNVLGVQLKLTKRAQMLIIIEVSHCWRTVLALVRIFSFFTVYIENS